MHHSRKRGLTVILSDSQFARQKNYCAIIDALLNMMKLGVISEEDFEKAQALMIEKYRPLIRYIS